MYTHTHTRDGLGVVGRGRKPYHNPCNVIVKHFCHNKVFWRVQACHLTQGSLQVTHIGHLAQGDEVSCGGAAAAGDVSHRCNDRNVT